MARTGEVFVLFCLFQVMWTGSFENKRKPVSEECQLYKICEHVDDYPIELARKLITELKSQGVYFDKEEPVPEGNIEPTSNIRGVALPLSQCELKSQAVLSDKKRTKSLRKKEFKLKGNSNVDVTPLCNFTTKTYQPKSLPNEHGKPQYILNDDTNPTYTFSMQICLDKNPIICDKLTGAESPFPTGYTGVCVQRYMLRRLYYINEQNKTAIDYFQIPTTCVCGLKISDK